MYPNLYLSNVHKVHTPKNQMKNLKIMYLNFKVFFKRILENDL